ncbi:histidinol dehydrogenase [Stackebrandtia nassauensis]|uniref:Histidinol dehydrogenase n=1 Tax=Stackebrandtia nassauensis (strain DSM 44728 / CIP 108903 / NRRL B-16338 / NBRC 102104 / LLR-40K-21) TaxID=446470 RepID=D3PZW2_STANL|nr:histidinol dehydrogenase [Stackebrandtia nassauensis]ADD43649.1 histidinol dehydrogenase [Stackebrandtia nassauensis DSM 44728]
MLKRIDLRGSTDIPAGLLPRARFDVAAALAEIQPLLDAIAHHGADPIRRVTAERDGVELDSLRVPAEALRDALDSLDPALRGSLEEAVSRVRAVHSAQRRENLVTEVAPGGVVTERFVPVRRVGLYVPGGLAPLASSVVMNVVPAQLAGVPQIAVASPPQRATGLPDVTILAVCAMLDVTEVYAVGGPAAIGMFAYGADECAPVDMITGPGNIYVTAAKRAVRGLVGIDAEAGTTEIAVLADDTADAAHVAADLISQAEHDPEAASVLVTPSAALADAVDAEVKAMVDEARHAQRIRIALSGPQSGIVLVDDLEQGLSVVDAYAAEHLEIQTEGARELAMRVTNAGAIFVGPYSPVSLGDYCAGSNHILPTGGCARHSSGLSVTSFLRPIQVIEYDREALAAVSDDVVRLAEAENLPSHGKAVTARFGR